MFLGIILVLMGIFFLLNPFGIVLLGVNMLTTILAIGLILGGVFAIGMLSRKP